MDMRISGQVMRARHAVGCRARRAPAHEQQCGPRAVVAITIV